MTRPQVPSRPPAWLPDPLDDALVRYWDGWHWTFHTAVRQAAAQPEPEAASIAPERVPELRPDIARAVSRVSGLLAGARKEIALLADYLRPEEEVLALSGAQGDGLGVLACTNQRLLFLFVGIVRRQLLEVSWNEAKAAIYNRSTKNLAVYTTKPTKRAVPAMSVRVANVSDAAALVEAAEAASAAPRLDVV